MKRRGERERKKKNERGGGRGGFPQGRKTGNHKEQVDRVVKKKEKVLEIAKTKRRNDGSGWKGYGNKREYDMINNINTYIYSYTHINTQKSTHNQTHRNLHINKHTEIYT